MYISSNLKRQHVWKSVEVHAIYELFYILGISKEGLQHFVNYLSAEDQQVFEPLFIAQYLFLPVNTIVKSYLLPWMQETYDGYYTTRNSRTSDHYLAKKPKVKLYLKYTLLVEVMKVVKKYGRNVPYNFEKAPELDCIRKGQFGEIRQNEQNQKILGIDGFTTIWLVTLPERFRNWYETRHNTQQQEHNVMSYAELPLFPQFARDDARTELCPHNPDSNSFDLLPDTWNLVNAFEHYLYHKDQNIWTTQSIQIEYNQTTYNNIHKKGKKKSKDNAEPNAKDGNDGKENASGENMAMDNDDGSIGSKETHGGGSKSTNVS